MPDERARLDASSPLVVGNGQGFWGDTPTGAATLLTEPRLNYLTLDYLAEVTMSLLQRARQRRPDAGFPADFPILLRRILPTCLSRGVRIVANAGGVNLPACAEAVERVVRDLGLNGVRIGVVSGDDLLDRLPELIDAGYELRNLETGEPLAPRLRNVVSANAYLGARPIAHALTGGADIVLTGRCADAALTLGPAMAHFGWTSDELDQLAGGTIAGHVIECGAQATGGNFTGWCELPSPSAPGFPFVEIDRDGSFVVTKPAAAGGAVTRDTVIAQLLYEIGDPRRYLTPDVTADFTSVSLEADGPDRVRVTGARGTAVPDELKVSIGVQDGWASSGQLTVPGPHAVPKARRTAEQLLDRLAAQGLQFHPHDVHVEFLGAGALLPPGSPQAQRSYDPPEVVMRIAVRDADRRKVEAFGLELAACLTSGPPGLTGFAAGRPRPSELIRFWGALLPAAMVHPTVEVREVSLT